MDAPAAVTKTISTKLRTENPSASSAVVAIRVYDVPKKGVAFDPRETRKRIRIENELTANFVQLTLWA